MALNMPDFSALTQQQRISADVPYKNIALGNPAETFLNAWQMATNVKLKQQEYEGRMAALLAKNRQMELKGQLDEAKFGLAMQKMELDYGYKGTMADIARERMVNAYQHQSDVFNFKQLEDQRRDNDVAGVASDLADLASEGITKSHPDYFRRVNEILSRHPNLPNSQAKDVRRQAGNESNASGREERLRLNDDYNRFVTDVGRRYYGGNTTVQNLDPILNPENLPDATQDKPFYDVWSTPKKKEGYKVIKGFDFQGNPKDYVTSMKELNDLKEQYKALEARKQNVPPVVNRPDLGVFPNEATTLQGKAERALADPYASPEAKAAAHKYLGY